MKRRHFLTSTAASLVPCATLGAAAPKQFRLWAIGDAHVETDLKHKRESMADAIRQSEREFDWDIAVNVGDFSGNQEPPRDDEGREVVRQFGALTKHRREDFYDIAGNHDASRQGEPSMPVDLWLGGHTHTNPDDNFIGRTHIERKWDVNFVNCCALTRWHGAERSRPMSRLLTFLEGSSEVLVQCWLHTNTHAPQGWYPLCDTRLATFA